MKASARVLSAMLLLAAAAVQGAAITTYSFEDPEAEARFKRLSHELRCLVCQNQSLADSNADLAQDLRDQVYTMVREGASDAEVVDYMVARYGDFVRYRPPVEPATYLLWYGPLLLLAGGLLLLLFIVRGRARAAVPELDAEERSRLQRLLGDAPDGERR